jgi:hypothetical protein
MGKKLAEHIGSILIVGLIFGGLAVLFQTREAEAQRSRSAVAAPYLSLQFVDFGNPLDRALFKETLDTFWPDSGRANQAVLEAIDAYREALFTDPSLKSGGDEGGLSWLTLWRLAGMYAGFFVVFTVVLLLTLYAAQGLAIFRFVRLKQGRESSLRELWTYLLGPAQHDVRSRPLRVVGRVAGLLGAALAKGLAYLILFSPAYVIGYALKTRLETNSIPFMILLGLLSNGLLITYTNKFFTLMVSEARKGYVETALAKGLSGQWVWSQPGGIRIGAVLRVHKKFPSHILDHIFLNAQYQYLPTLKEQGSFLITGLIIGEMALNIQGHMGYELLQQLLYRRYDVALLIIFGIFLMVKATEILVDWQWWRESLRYENVSS